MDSDEFFAKNVLERCSYRYLQQMAKSLCLPSNVKKVYLVELICAKKFSTPDEVESIVQKVKIERLKSAQMRKKKNRKKLLHLQGTEISSTINSQSPPISSTPRRPGHIVVTNSDLRQAVMKYNTYTHTKTHSSPKQNGSDRVLRSFNLRTIKKPSHSVVNMNSMLGVIKAQNAASKMNETRINIVSQNGKFPKLNLTAKCIVKKERPVLNTVFNLKNRNPAHLLALSNNARPHLHPIRRIQRALSGIYPINQKETPKSYEYIQSIGFRRQDGKITKINALVQKPNQKKDDPCNITVQDLINSNIDSQTFANTNITEYIFTDSAQNSMYPNMSPLDQNESDTVSLTNSELIKENEDMFSKYYHKKIRGEQVRYQRSISQKEREKEEMLPRITDVFSKFNDHRDMSQPLYVQVSEQSRMASCPQFINKTHNDMMLESLYNFKNIYVTNQPLLQIATTTNTRCVYSTPVIATAMAQQPSTISSENYSMPSYEQANQYPCTDMEAIPRIYDFLKLTEQEVALRNDYDKYGDFSASDSSLETSQDLGASVTIPEMVEDALEIISQDGDYLERIGMDIRMQCILCSWAGPKIILDHHIRKEHSSEIHKHDNNEWNITYTLGSLVKQRLWQSQVIEHQATLYVLSAKCEQDCFSAAISTLSSEADSPKTGNITIYNRVTGEPYTWEGEIQHLPPNLPYDNESNCLKLELSKMDLLPNSANLKLLNGELVIKSPGKVVVGQPVLNDIHIVVFVKIY